MRTARAVLLCAVLVFQALARGASDAEPLLVLSDAGDSTITELPAERHVEAKSYAELVAIEACDGYREAFSVCLSLSFDQKVSGSSPVVCKLFDDRPERAPKVLDFYSPGVTSSVCNTSMDDCKIVLQETVKPGGSSYAFCMQLLFDQVPPRAPIILPECPPECGVYVETAEVRGLDVHTKFGKGDLAGVVLLAVYVGWSFAFEKVRIIHETGVSVLVGLFIGGVLKAWDGSTVSFSYDAFSFIILPMVIFGAGFNLQKKNFFRYSTYILMLGLIGTVLIFTFIFTMSANITFSRQDGKQITLTSQHRLIMASVLASTDTVAPMAFLPSETYPLLYAVVFGEGVLNDVVSILLSTATAGETTMPPIGTLFAQILYFCGTSAIVGVIFGLGMSLMFKWATGLQKEDEFLKPCALLLLGNYACYILAELMDISSIFALFICALLCGHYAKHSLCDQAQTFACELAEYLCYLAEAFVFGYFGLTAVSFLGRPETFSIQLILGYSLCIVMARFGSVILLDVALRVLKGGQRLSVRPKEMVTIALAGCMRGTIAYALILRAVPPDKMRHSTDTVLVTTVLGIVLVNCLVFGGAFPLVLKLLGLNAQLERAVSEPLGAGEVRPYPARLRNGLHNGWRNLDRKFLKPMFRASYTSSFEASEEAMEPSESGVSLPPQRAATDASGCTTFSTPQGASNGETDFNQR